MEQLQLEVEALLFDQDEGSLIEMIGKLGIEHNVTGKTEMQKIKIIRLKRNPLTAKWKAMKGSPAEQIRDQRKDQMKPTHGLMVCRSLRRC